MFEPLADTDRDWEHFAAQDPYWAVLTDERFRRENLDSEALSQFYSSGERHVAWMLQTIRDRVDPDFRPSTALDFGCGVGRLLFPLARRCRRAIGVDISESMLREARSRAAQQQLTNVVLVKGDDALSHLAEGVDLITSYIVFQHIPTDRGQKLLQKLVELLSDRGVGVLHFTYSKAIFNRDPTAFWPSSAPLYSTTPRGALWATLSATNRHVRRRIRRLWDRASGASSQGMQMNPYTLNPLFHILQLAGVRRMHVEFTDHGGEYGAVLFFQRTPSSGYLV